MKKILNTLVLILLVIFVSNQVSNFDDARNWLETFKALFWLVLSINALWATVDSLRKNNWPWEIWK